MARSLRLPATLVLIAALLALAPSAQAATAPEATVQAINDVRTAHGLRPLSYSPVLARSARRYSNFLMRRNALFHVSPIRASKRYRSLGEVLAMHRGTRARVALTIRQWMHSPPHRAALLNPRYRVAGAGRTIGRFGRMKATIWVVHLGAR